MTGEIRVTPHRRCGRRGVTYAEVHQSHRFGNPMVIEKASIDAEVARLSRLRTQHRNAVPSANTSAASQRRFTLPERRLDEIRQDIALRRDTHGDAFVMQIDRQEIRDRGIAGELLPTPWRANQTFRAATGRSAKVRGLSGFRVTVYVRRGHCSQGSGNNTSPRSARLRSGQFAPSNMPSRT